MDERQEAVAVVSVCLYVSSSRRVLINEDEQHGGGAGKTKACGCGTDDE